jgi:hypothetical protein
MPCILSFPASNPRTVIARLTAGFGNGSLQCLWIGQVSIKSFHDLSRKIETSKEEGINYKYPSMTVFDVEEGSAVLCKSFSCLCQAMATHRSDSVMSNTVSQVSKPSAIRTSRYPHSPNRSNSSANSAIWDRRWLKTGGCRCCK